MKIVKILCVGILFLGAVPLVFAQEAGRTAKILSVNGDVNVRHPGAKWVTAQVDMVLAERDILVTKDDSEAVLNVDGKGRPRR